MQSPEDLEDTPFQPIKNFNFNKKSQDIRSLMYCNELCR